MPPTVQIGSILWNQSNSMKKSFAVESEPYSGTWSLVKRLNGFALDRKIHAAGWNFLFMAEETKAMFFGTPSSKGIHSALQRILAEIGPQHFNSLEVTGIDARHFLGVPYAVVTAHSRHVQQNWNQDDLAQRTAECNGELVRA